MKNLVKLFGLSLFFTIFLAACNQQRGTQGTSESPTVRQDTTAGSYITVDQLKSDLREMSNDLDSVARKSGDDFKNDAKRVVSDINRKVENFENRADRQDEQLDPQTQEALNKIKNEGQQLEQKLDNYTGNQNENNWQQFQEEVKRDFTVFGESVKDFFQDNV
jgi:ElaB/YqjD/DUF883 family membrane-anchored ribosome-binding protein